MAFKLYLEQCNWGIAPSATQDDPEKREIVFLHPMTGDPVIIPMSGEAASEMAEQLKMPNEELKKKIDADRARSQLMEGVDGVPPPQPPA
jgi:hypothetical protein